jgi:predicted DNA-binding transcriptional regulator AlpA
MLLRRLRFADLLDLGIVKNRATLQNWIHDRGFPPGQLTGPNSRTWSEDEIHAWISRRPSAPKETPRIPKGKRGRPRKAEAQIKMSALT